MDLLNNQDGVRAFTEVYINESFQNGQAIEEFRKSIRPSMSYRDFKTQGLGGCGAYLEWLRQQSKASDATGFKLMYGHLVSHPSLFSYFVTQRFRLIHLVRFNTLDIAVSSQIANITNTKHINATQKAKRVRVDVNLLREQIVAIEKKRKIAQRILSVLPVPCLQISYEALSSNTGTVLTQVLGFLDVASPPKVLSGYKKITPPALGDKVENELEIRRFLEGTKFERYLVN